MRFATYRADLLRGPLTYEAALQQKGIVGTPDMVAARIAELQETAGLDGISAEINVGSLLSHDQVMTLAPPLLSGSHAAVQIADKKHLRRRNMGRPPPGEEPMAKPPQRRHCFPRSISSPLNRRYWTIFGLLATGSVLDFFDFFIVGYLVAQLGPQWHLTYGQSSLILLPADLERSSAR